MSQHGSRELTVHPFACTCSLRYEPKPIDYNVIFKFEPLHAVQSMKRELSEIKLPPNVKYLLQLVGPFGFLTLSLNLQTPRCYKHASRALRKSLAGPLSLREMQQTENDLNRADLQYAFITGDNSYVHR
jgi:hypothetical protein